MQVLIRPRGFKEGYRTAHAIFPIDKPPRRDGLAYVLREALRF
jgi:hypothetical protein